MNPYARLASAAADSPAQELVARLIAWHDEMVAHKRRVRAGAETDLCHESCPHEEARALWLEAARVFGNRARDLTFLAACADAAVPA
jgi:hypothetical protein